MAKRSQKPKKETPAKGVTAEKGAKADEVVKKPNQAPKRQKASDELRLNKYISNSGVCSRRDADIYIQSGNVFVNSDEENASKVGFVIKQEIFKTFGHEVPVVVVNQNDLKNCLVHNPFLKDKDLDTKKLYVAFLSNTLRNESINDLKISQFKPDEAAIDGNKIYIKYAIGAGKTRLDQKYIEKKLNLTATIRNWNTVTQLLKIYEGQ
jgi:uncharacterized protein (DUF1697 family)